MKHRRLGKGELPEMPKISRSWVGGALHEAFRERGLGHSAAQIFDLLSQGEALTINEISKRTGRGRTTVWRVLGRMAQILDPSTGEMLAMVERDGKKWRACDGVDLDAVARVVGTAGASKRQHEQHERERAAHRQALLHGRARRDR